MTRGLLPALGYAYVALALPAFVLGAHHSDAGSALFSGVSAWAAGRGHLEVEARVWETHPEAIEFVKAVREDLLRAKVELKPFA